MKAMREMELLKAGTDAQGDTFTPECVAKVVEDFVGPLPVTIGFDPRAVPVGTVEALRLDGDTVLASVALDEKGERAVAEGHELASGGTFELGKNSLMDVKTIEAFKLTGAALTKQKVK